MSHYLSRAYLYVVALAAVAGVRTALWTQSSPRLISRARSLSLRSPSNELPPRSIDVDAVVRAIRRTSRIVPHATCLTQALAGMLLLQRFGFAATLRLGVNVHGKRFLAHAWLEHEGQIILGAAGAAGMTALPQLESADRLRSARSS